MSKKEIIKKGYLDIKNFLMSYQKIWEKEVIDSYPQAFLEYPNEWPRDLENLSFDDLEKLDSRCQEFFLGTHSFFQSSTGKLIKQIEDLEKKWAPPHYNHQNNLELKMADMLFLKPKKKYEIEQLLTPLQDFFSDLEVTSAYDLGGGVGHLSRIISEYFKTGKNQTIKVTSIDINSDFQKSGEKKWKKFKKVNFNYLNADLNTLDIDAIAEHNYATVGLHTCGELAISQMRLMKNSKAMACFNVPCCYQHLKIESANLSRFAKENPLPWTINALTLAAKAHYREADNPKHKKSFQDKWQVKNYRYALQMILCKHHLNHISTVGEAPMKDYYQPFADYALAKLKQFKITNETHRSLEIFYSSEATQSRLKELFLCNIIRWQFGRLLELLIIYDRHLWALEQNFKVDCFSVFNERISPRNTAFILKK